MDITGMKISSFVKNVLMKTANSALDMAIAILASKVGLSSLTKSHVLFLLKIVKFQQPFNLKGLSKITILEFMNVEHAKMASASTLTP